MRCFFKVVASVVIAICPLTGFAATFGETVMVPKLLANLEPDTQLHWLLERHLSAPAEDAPPPAGGWRRLLAEEGELLTLTALSDGKLVVRDETRQLAEFPVAAPHPILLMFLENVMRSVSQETGGSPHYIRNRMRTTLGAAEVHDGRLSIAPFRDDPSKDRFGAFADLEIEVQWEPENPAALLYLSAKLPNDPERYSEILTLQPKGE